MLIQLIREGDSEGQKKRETETERERAYQRAKFCSTHMLNQLIREEDRGGQKDRKQRHRERESLPEG